MRFASRRHMLQLFGFLTLLFVLGMTALALQQRFAFNTFRDHYLADESNRLQASIMEESYFLKRVLQDYATWTELEKVVEQSDSDRAQVIFEKQSDLERFNLDEAWLVSPDDRLLHHWVRDNNSVRINPFIRQKAASQSLPERHYFILSPEGLNEIGDASVMRSKERDGNPGRLIFSRHWDADWLRHLELVTGYTARIIDARAPSTPQAELNGLVIIRLPLPGEDMNPVAQLELTRNQSAVADMLRSRLIAMWVSAGFVMLLMTGFYWSVGRLLIQPLEQLSVSLFLRDETHLQPMLHREDEFGQLANLVAATLHERKILEQNSQHGPLTRLANRRRFDELLGMEWESCQVTRQPLSLLMMDIDFFKQYNDHYGHPEGDRCLQTIADILSRTPRHKNDLVARLGGEEFATLLPFTDQAGAAAIAEQLRASVEAAAIPHAGLGDTAVVTISIGLCTWYPDEGSTSEDLLEKADQALYQAKAGGRNKVTLMEAPLPAFRQDQSGS